MGNCWRFINKSLIYTKTNPTTVPIGERRKPNPYDKPGFIRVDSVHQGDSDKQKGVYHVNLVDEVTQVEIMVAVEKISEYYLVPALVDALDQFPFTILNFHSDNGSEYINKKVSKLLNKRKIEQTKSRSRHISGYVFFYDFRKSGFVGTINVSSCGKFIVFHRNIVPKYGYGRLKYSFNC